MSRLLCVAVLLLAVPIGAHACEGAPVLEKSVDTDVAAVGRTVEYYIDLWNNTDCWLQVEQVVDSVLGDITADFPPELEPGGTANLVYPHEVPPGGPDPLVNVVTLSYRESPGAPVVELVAEASLDVLYPDFVVEVTCMPPPAPGEEVGFLMQVTNTGDTDLDLEFTGLGSPIEIPLGFGGVLALEIYVPCVVVSEACLDVTITAELPPAYQSPHTMVAHIEHCCECTGAPVEEWSWGTIKALYR